MMTFKEEYMAPEALSVEFSPESPLAYSGGGSTENLDERSNWGGGWS